MNRQAKILKSNECNSCKEQMTTIHMQNGYKLCYDCFEIIRIDTHEETQTLKDREPRKYAFKLNEEKTKEVFLRIFTRYQKTGQRLIFDRDVLDSESGEYLFKDFVSKMWNSLDREFLYGKK